MRLTIKMVVAAWSWTIAAGMALARSLYGDSAFDVWAVLAAAFAAVVTVLVATEYIALWAVGEVVRRIAAERDETVRRARKAMREDNQALADRIVERLASKQDKTVARIAAEIAQAMREEVGAPTPIR